ncbi:uncharacterized protein EKO05_0005530 [Ascochyta rabiei]|uniref:uncharacterized protein n=1 Tax=Didymella rabiei TaxID=5454 RepID=UPI0021FB712B|nr:uncharacterized protein EKO05_0005530 [Ascochyta rabiei]UPX15067.1 hypothetical protein EKO05_0005530 [Ascochyta rabiei]
MGSKAQIPVATFNDHRDRRDTPQRYDGVEDLPEVRNNALASTPAHATESDIESGPSHNTSVCVDTENSQRSERTSQRFDSSTHERVHTEAFKCSFDAQTGLEPHCPETHVLDEIVKRLPTAWKDIRRELPDSYKWDATYDTTYGGSKSDQSYWTCTLLPDRKLRQIPLTNAGALVVLLVRHRSPPVGGVYSRRYPRPSNPIDYRSELDLCTIRDMFQTFEGSVGFYVLINSLMQVTVELHMSHIESIMALSILLLATAFGPLVIGPLSEVYGHQKILHASNVWFLVWNIVCGSAKTKEELIAARFLAGFGASSTYALAGACWAMCGDRSREGGVWEFIC